MVSPGGELEGGAEGIQMRAEPTATPFVCDVHFGEGEEGEELDAAVPGTLKVFSHSLKHTHTYTHSDSKMQESCDFCITLTSRL